MVATRMIAFAIALVFGTPVAANQVTVYSAISGYGDNNVLDVSAQSACDLTDGCRSIFTKLPVGEGYQGGAEQPCGGALNSTGNCGLCKAEPNKLCWTFPTPVNACSRGTSAGCIFPEGWDVTVSPAQLNDPNCLCTGKLAGAIPTTVPIPADPNGTGAPVFTAVFEATSCGGVEGICSDGDVDILTGGFGVSLGTHINGLSLNNIGNESNGALDVLNGIGLTGPRFAIENPPRSVTPQRAPGTLNNVALSGTEIIEIVGGQAFAVVPITGALDPAVFTDATERAHLTALRDEFGVRGLRGFADSTFSEWGFNSGSLVGSSTDSLIVTHPCDAAIGWSVDDPVVGHCENDTGLACTDNFPTGAAGDPCGMLLDVGCTAGSGLGDPTNSACASHCIGDLYCWEDAAARVTPAYLWSRDIAASELTDTTKSLVVAAGGDISGKCPPDCGVDYVWSVFEQEATDFMLAAQSKPGVSPVAGFPGVPPLPALTAEDTAIGFQAVFDHYSGTRAGLGDVLQIVLVFSQTWINQGDLRCFMGGDRGVLNDLSDANNFRRTGRCSTLAAQIPCVPFAEDVPNILGLGITMNDCISSATDTLDCRGCGATPPHLVPVAKGGTGFTSPVFPVTANDPARGWIPVGYDSHTADCGTPPNACDTNLNLLETIGRTDLNGRIGGLMDVGYNIKVPLLVAATTGFAGSQNRDNDNPGVDAKLIGNIVGGTGSAGLTLPDVYGDGAGAYLPTRKLSWNGATLGVGFTFPPADPGLITDPNFFLVFSTNYGPGPDGIMGCIGDNSLSLDLPPCDNPLNITGSGALTNTGVDDFPTRTQAAKPPLAPGVNCGPGTAGGGLSGPCNMFTTQQDLRPKAANVLADFPSYPYVGAGSGRDVKVFANRNTDFVYKFDTVFCPLGLNGEPLCVGFDDPEFDRRGSANDQCPAAFDPAQVLSNATGTSGQLGSGCLCGDSTVNDGNNLTLGDAQIAALVAVGTALPASVDCPVASCDVYWQGAGQTSPAPPGVDLGDAQFIALTAVAQPGFDHCVLGCGNGPLGADPTGGPAGSPYAGNPAWTFDKQGCR